MSRVDWTRVATVGVTVLAGGYVLYKLLGKAGEAAGDAFDKAVDAARNSAPVKGTSNIIADAYLALTLPGAVKVRGTVKLPDGRVVPMANISIDENFLFRYQGVLYLLQGRAMAGVGADYVAIRPVA